MRPRVISHIGVSVDGRLDWAPIDPGQYYELAGKFEAGAMLCGSNTVLAAYEGQDLPKEETEAQAPRETDPADTRQWLVVVDSRGQIRFWHAVREAPYWRDVVVLVSACTPPDYLEYLNRQHIDHIQAGDERVDLAAALEALQARYGVEVVRVDSGGVLNGALLRAGLVDEISLLISPSLVGGTSPRSIFVAPDLTSADGVIPLKLTHVERLPGDALWLRYALGSEEV